MASSMNQHRVERVDSLSLPVVRPTADAIFLFPVTRYSSPDVHSLSSGFHLLKRNANLLLVGSKGRPSAFAPG